VTAPDNEALPRTRAALVVYDGETNIREAILQSPHSHSSDKWLWRYEAAERAAWAKVVAAFTEDTREVNTPSQAAYVTMTDVRHMLGQSCGKYCARGAGCAPNPEGAPTHKNSTVSG